MSEKILVFISDGASPADWEWFEAGEINAAYVYVDEAFLDSRIKWAGIYHTTLIEEMRESRESRGTPCTSGKSTDGG